MTVNTEKTSIQFSKPYNSICARTLHRQRNTLLLHSNKQVWTFDVRVHTMCGHALIEEQVIRKRMQKRTNREDNQQFW